MFTAVITLQSDSVVAPHKFAHQLETYVIAPELREKDALVEIMRLSTGRLVKVEIRGRGTADKPKLDLTVKSRVKLHGDMIEEVCNEISWYLGLTEDLKPFYLMSSKDPVMQAAISHQYGSKPKSSFPVFKTLIDCICAQNVVFKRLFSMMTAICDRFGDKLKLEGKEYSAFPSPDQLAEAPLDDLRACKVGYRDKIIKNVAQAIVNKGIAIERLNELSLEDAQRVLLGLPGVGPYTANLTLSLARRERTVIHLDTYVREVFRHFYFRNRAASDDQIISFVNERWPGYQATAIGYLTTHTDVWAENLGKKFRLKSWAGG